VDNYRTIFLGDQLAINSIFIPETKAYYQVGDKKFLNNIDALIYSSENGMLPVDYNLDFDFFRNYNWQQEPVHDIKFYLRKHASIIQQKYDDISIMYSGGTDSHTIFTTFTELNIPNIRLVNYTEVNEKNAKWIDSKKPNKTLKEKYTGVLTGLNYSTVGFEENYVTYNPTEKDWIKNISDFKIGNWNSDVNSPLSQYYHYHNHNPGLLRITSNSCVVWGFEKPKLCIEKGWWCWYTFSGHWLYPSGLPATHKPDYVYFFITDDVPEIQVKLSWLKIAELEKIILSNKILIDKESLFNIQSDSGRYYRRLNHAMGYKAVNLVLDDSFTKDFGYYRQIHLRELQQIENENRIKLITNEYYDSQIKSRIHSSYRNDEHRKTIQLYSKPIPIRPVSKELIPFLDKKLS
jgi:hypothetical protein